MNNNYYYEIQYSPIAKTLLGIEILREIAANLAEQFTENGFYDLDFLQGQDQGQVQIVVLKHKELEIKIVPYIDKKGIRVISFDPFRELHGIKTGQHRI